MKKSLSLLVIFKLITTNINAQGTDQPDSSQSDYLLNFDDFDWTSSDNISNQEESVIIGTQTWMTKNLDVVAFKNGDLITEAKNDSEWDAAYIAKTPAWCYYNYESSNGPAYGKIYNVYAATDPRGLAPAGWHVPTKAEWDILLAFLPQDAATGTKLKSTSPGDYAFVQGGYRSQDGFISIGKLGVWWSATKKTISGAWGASTLDGGYGFSLYFEHNLFYEGDYSSEGLSVRCIKDN